jgi:hypothetical protein
MSNSLLVSPILSLSSTRDPPPLCLRRLPISPTPRVLHPASIRSYPLSPNPTDCSVPSLSVTLPQRVFGNAVSPTGEATSDY